MKYEKFSHSTYSRTCVLEFIMDRIDFRTAVEDGGVIHIPVEYEREIAKGKIVHVTLSAETRRTRLVERMINHPFYDPDFKYGA